MSACNVPKCDEAMSRASAEGPLRGRLNRREFLGSSAKNAAGVAAGIAGLAGVATAGLADFPGMAGAPPVRVAVIGVRNQGRVLAETLARLDETQVVALCDVDAGVLPAAVRAVESVGSKTPRCERDYRRLLDAADIDAVCIATPDHGHAVQCQAACAAGKDVYLESPVTHTLEEGERVLETASRSQRIVQVGLQQRSGVHFTSAVEYLRSGGLGKVALAKAWTAHQRKSIGHKGNALPPADVDYAAWLGSAPQRPFNPNRFHYNWHWFWDYGSGELGNWGVHLLDLARWGLGVEYPESVAAVGGKYVFDDDQETPDTLQVQFGYAGKLITWEHRLWTHQGQEGRSAAVAFYGEQGTLVVDRSGWKVYGLNASATASGDLLAAHLRNFAVAVRTRELPACDLRTGHISSALCHLGNVAYRVGRALRFDAATQRVVDDAAAHALLHPSPSV